jgi:hypothetical protein
VPVSFSIPGELPAFHAWLADGIQTGIRKGFVSTAFRIVEVITTEIIPDQNPPPIFQSAYRAAWHAEPTKDGADIVNTVPYASVIEDGARGENIKIGRVMIDAIAEWVLRKGLVGKLGKGGASSTQLTQARAAAWAIAVHMKKVGIFNRNGTQGLQIGAKGLAKGREFIGEEVAHEIFRALEKR